MSSWDYLLFQLNGDGTEDYITRITLAGPSPTRVLSGPHQLTGQIRSPKSDIIDPSTGSTILRRWKTTVYAVSPADTIFAGGVLADYSIDDDVLSLDVTGLTTVLVDQPYDGNLIRSMIDPFDIVRDVWDHIQLQPGGNVGMVVDSGSSGVLVGTPTATEAPEEAQAAKLMLDRLTGDGDTFVNTAWTWDGAPEIMAKWAPALQREYAGDITDVPKVISFLENYVAAHPADTIDSASQDLDGTGPVKINWWSSANLGEVIDSLAGSTPFDYLEEHDWDGENLTHRLRLGCPSIGVRRTDTRFVLGQNVRKIPTETYDGDDVVTEIWVLGAGEGRTRVRGIARINPVDSIRRVRVIQDKSCITDAQAQERARIELDAYQPDIPGAGITELLVDQTEESEFGTYDVGDEVIYSGDHQWGDIAVWVKILKMTALPESGQVLVTVQRADTIRA